MYRLAEAFEQLSLQLMRLLLQRQPVGQEVAPSTSSQASRIRLSAQGQAYTPTVDLVGKGREAQHTFHLEYLRALS